ncbi:MAG: hypothetical protein IPJ84_13645 [Bdellovibrionales bacterium]|nr:hypothetical protein [Bdellovibrionales bacterium]
MVAWFSIFQKPSVFHVLGLGMAMSDTELWRPNVLREIRPYFSKNSIEGIIHAWSFGRGMLVGLDVDGLNRECSYFSDKALRDACFFGIGRTIYFRDLVETTEDLAALAKLHDVRSIWMGIGFAGVFVSESGDNNRVPLSTAGDRQRVEARQQGAHIAELYREVLRGENIDIRDDTSIQLRQCILRCRDEGVSVTTCLNLSEK